MAITIPSGAKKTFEKVLGAMGGEDYSYYLFDVTKVEDDPEKKVQVALKVYVPLSERATAVHNVQASLDGDELLAIAPIIELFIFLSLFSFGILFANSTPSLAVTGQKP